MRMIHFFAQFSRLDRLLKEDFDKKRLELTSEIEAHQMQLVADQERIASLMSRVARIKPDLDHPGAAQEDCALCREYEQEASTWLLSSRRELSADQPTSEHLGAG